MGTLGSNPILELGKAGHTRLPIFTLGTTATGFRPLTFKRRQQGATSVVFTGSFQRSLDSKLRVLLPKRLRNALPDCPAIYLTPGTDQCLELHTDHSLSELASKADQSSAGLKNVRSFSRLFYARAEQCDIDKQGRIRIPGSLAQIAELEKDIVFIGVGSHWEIWNQARWESYLDSHHQTFDEIAETTFDPPLAHQNSQLMNSSDANSTQSNSLQAVKQSQAEPDAPNRKVAPK